MKSRPATAERIEEMIELGILVPYLPTNEELGVMAVQIADDIDTKLLEELSEELKKETKHP